MSVNHCHYVSHLASMSHLLPVYFKQDVIGEQGNLLFYKGQIISDQNLSLIKSTPLHIGIEQLISMDQYIDANSLYHDIVREVRQSALTGNAAETLTFSGVTFEQFVLQACKDLEQHPVFMQKLTVLSYSLPQFYTKTLISAVLSLMIGRQLELDIRSLNNIFFAAMIQNIGMLHIEPNLINHNRNFNSLEWRAMKTHVAIVKKIALLEENCPAYVVKILEQHCERCDGTGYPRGLIESQLTLESQIIGMSNLISSVWYSKLASDGKNLRDLLPILQMNSDVHSYDVYCATFIIFKSADLCEKGRITQKEMALALRETKTLARKLHRWYQLINLNIHRLSSQFTKGQLATLLKANQQLITTSNEAGLFEFDNMYEVEQSFGPDLSAKGRFTRDHYLMLEEFRWKLELMTKLMDDFMVRKEILNNSSIEMDLVFKNMAAISAYRQAG